MAAAELQRKTRSSRDWQQKLQTRLLAWFAAHARDLPWRGTDDLYAIWVSEIMLQQTQVVTVIPYFQRFLARFPTVRALAAAKEEDVLRLWEGLGYYRRARQLHAAAQQIVAQHGGEFPATFADVLALPGVGRYTAGAILSIGRNQQLPILEANTIRVYSRLLADDGDVYAPAGQERLWRFAEKILPAQQVGHFNQALMELGATLCTPREPPCLLCPLASLCPTCRSGRQDSIPAPKKKKQYESLAEAAVVIRRRDGKILLRRCQEGERWAGLWDFPRILLASGMRQLPDFPASQINQIEQSIAKLTGINITLGDEFATLKHGVTRFRITLRCLSARYDSGRAHQRDGLRWLRVEELSSLPLCTTGRRVSRMLAP